MCTRSNAPWQSTMVLSASRALSWVRSCRDTIFRDVERSRLVVSTACPDRFESSIAAPLDGADQLQGAQDVDDILHAKGLAFTLLPLRQIHRHLEDAVGAPQALDEDLGLKAVAARLDAQA